MRSQLAKIEQFEKLLKTRIDRDNAATASSRGPPPSPGGKRIRIRSKSTGAAPSLNDIVAGDQIDRILYA